MKPGKSESEIPLWKLERYLIGELPAQEMERIDKLKAADPELAGWLKALEAEHADLQATHPTGRMAGRIWNKLQQAEKPRGRGGFRIAAAMVPAFALVLLLVIVPGRLGTPDGPAPAPASEGEVEKTRLKGSLPELYLYRKTGGDIEALKPGGPVRAGDLIQTHYEAAGMKYGAIFSLDGNGIVTRHLPERGNRSVALTPAGRIALASAFELDAAPGREDFHFLASDRPFDLDSALARLPPVSGSNGGIHHTVFPLTKESRK
jgi:hypothetical protein